jgi:RHS repeat-associated protein
MIHQALDNTAIHAVDSLIIADNVVNNNAAIVYQAGSSISLKAGFSANAGTDFVAKIADCPQSGYETDEFTQRSNNEYLYDPNGNQTKDPNKGIITEYNYLNLPFKTTFDNGNIIEWLYLADGTKLQKTVKRNGLANPILKQDYIGNIEYVNDTLDAVYLQDAKAAFNSGIFLEYQYYLSDHLGNNRVLFADSNGDGSIDVNTEILQTSDYYPFGLQMEGNYIQNTEREDRYKFNGMERNIDFGVGLDMAKYRTYDPAIGRWLQIDPDAEQFYSLTPYNNNFNNPIRFDDPDGDNPIKLLKAAYNVGKRAYKTYKKTGKLNAKSIGNAVKDEVFSIVDNVSTIFDSESSTGDKVLAAFDLVTGFGGEAKATGKTLGLLDDAKDAKKAEGFADDTKVVRGGTCKCEQFENGSGVTVGTDGKLDGVSVNSAPGKSVSELSEGIKNGQVGVTTVGDVKKAGGNITPSPNDRNPNHATLSGITGKQAEELFNPTIKNPSKNK